jgi:hypothetical protein
MTEAFKVLRHELIADDGSGRRLIQFTLPGREFETAEGLEAEGLIKREFIYPYLKKARSAPAPYVHGTVARQVDGIFIAQLNCPRTPRCVRFGWPECRRRG